MFGIKTKIIRTTEKYVVKLLSGRLTNKLSARELMLHFKVDEYGHRADTFSGDMGYGFVHYGLIRASKPHNILCIGSRYGYIPAVLGQACKDNGYGHVDFLDPGYGQNDKDAWTGVGYWKTENGRRSFSDFGLDIWVKHYLERSDNYAKNHKRKIFDYIYIDGNHSYKGVKNDFDLFYKNLRTGGFMLFHDINVKNDKSEGRYGVHRFWNEIKRKKYHTIEFPFEGSGLGIIQK